MIDDTTTLCPRCYKADAPLGSLCEQCIQQLTIDANGGPGGDAGNWRAQWQRECDAALRLTIYRNPNYANEIAATYDGIIAEYANELNDSDFADIVSEAKKNFLARVARVTRPHSREQ